MPKKNLEDHLEENSKNQLKNSSKRSFMKKAVVLTAASLLDPAMVFGNPGKKLVISSLGSKAIPPALEDYIQKKAKSWIKDHHMAHIQAACVSKQKTPSGMLPCANLIKEILVKVGAKNTQILQAENSYPAVYGEFKSPNPKAKTVLIGGHYDVQPAEEKAWTIGKPFQPKVATIKGESRLVGRGSSDDGQALTHLDAIDAYLKTRAPLPVNIKIFYEGGEERGSPDMDKLIEKYKALLAADMVLLTDSGNIRQGVPAITYRSRGIVSAYVKVKTGENDPHSGDGGGVVCNANMALMKILAGLYNGKTQKVLIPEFYNKVKPLSPKEEEHLTKLKFDEDEFFRKGYGVQHLITKEVKKAMWAQPQFECHALYRGKKKGELISNNDTNKTVTQAEAYCTMRLVPEQDPYEIAELFKKQVLNLAQETCLQPEQIEVEIEGRDYPASIDINSEYIQTRGKALKQVFGAEPDIVPIGGTEPIVGFYQSILKLPVIYDSFDTFKDNIHGNDESFSIDNLIAGVRANILTYQLLGEMK